MTKEICPDVSGQDESPYRRNVQQAIIRQAINEVVGENIYTPDYDWDIWHKIQELQEQNGLPDGMTAEDVYQEFINVFRYED